jgi:predicted acylesterase/phospholipase RssA
MRDQARRGQPGGKHRKLGLALAGGGPLGGIYEVGALVALAEALEGLDFNELDVYVGVSSGGFVAAGLANGITPAEMYHMFIADPPRRGATGAELNPEIFLRPAFGEYWRRAAGLPRLLGGAFWRYLKNPFSRGLWESFAALGRAIPTGVFDNAAIDRYLTRLFSTDGRSNDFRRLKHQLFLIATDLDTGASVKFGAPGHDALPISRAIEASAALPGLFPPVEIDGRHYVDGALKKTLHASVALDEGVELLLCVNPLVPFDASNASTRNAMSVKQLAEGGLPLVLAQTFRAIIHSRMEVGMAKYVTQYAHADVVLFEPHRDDARMFFTNIFSYSHRRQLCDNAYRRTRADLLRRAETLAPVFAKHGVRLRADLLAESSRHVEHAVAPAQLPAMREPTVKNSVQDLGATLDRLQSYLRQQHPNAA